MGCLLYRSFHALSMISSQHSVQQNAKYCSQMFTLQCHVEHSYMLQSHMGSSSGNHIKVTLLRTELAIHVHNKKMQKGQTVKM